MPNQNVAPLVIRNKVNVVVEEDEGSGEGSDSEGGAGRRSGEPGTALGKFMRTKTYKELNLTWSGDDSDGEDAWWPGSEHAF